MANALYYSYRDVNGDVFGPFSAQQMMYWYKNGSLSEELEIFVQPENGEHLITKLKMLMAVNGKEEPFRAVSDPLEEITFIKRKTIKQEISATPKNPVSSNGKSSQELFRNVKTEVPRDHDSENNNNSQSVAGIKAAPALFNSNVASDNKGFKLITSNKLATRQIKTEPITATEIAAPQYQYRESINNEGCSRSVPDIESVQKKGKGSELTKENLSMTKDKIKTEFIPSTSVEVVQIQQSNSRCVPNNESIQKTQNQSMTKNNINPEWIPAIALSQNRQSINQTTTAYLPETVQKKNKDPEPIMEPAKSIPVPSLQNRESIESIESIPFPESDSVIENMQRKDMETTRSISAPDVTIPQKNPVAASRSGPINDNVYKKDKTAIKISISATSIAVVENQEAKNKSNPFWKRVPVPIRRGVENTKSISAPSVAVTQSQEPISASSVSMTHESSPRMPNHESTTPPAQKSIAKTKRLEHPATVLLKEYLKNNYGRLESDMMKDQGNSASISQKNNFIDTKTLALKQLLTHIAATTQKQIDKITSVSTSESVLFDGKIQKNNKGPEPTNLFSWRSQENRNTGSIPAMKQSLIDKTAPDVFLESVPANKNQKKDKEPELTLQNQSSSAEDLDNNESILVTDFAVFQKATTSSNGNGQKNNEDLRWLDEMIADSDTDDTADELSKSQKESVPTTEVVALKDKGSETGEFTQKVVEKRIDGQKSSEYAKISSALKSGNEKSEVAISAVESEPLKQVPDAQNSVEMEEDDDDIQIIAYIPKKTVFEKTTPSVAVLPYKAPIPSSPSDEAPLPTAAPSTSSHYLRPTMSMTDSMPLFRKTTDTTDQLLPIEEAEFELFRLVSTIKHLPPNYLTFYSNFLLGFGQTCGLCGQYLRGLRCLFAHLITDDHLAQVRKQSISEADIEFWTTKIREIYIWGKKNCIIDNGVIAKMNEPDIGIPTIVQQNIATNDMAILQQNIETSKTFSKLYDKWKGHDNLCFDILVSSDFITYCDCCGIQFNSPSIRLRHMFSIKHYSKMSTLYDQKDLDNVNTAIEIMSKMPEWCDDMPRDSWRSYIEKWKNDYERRCEIVPLENQSSTGFMKTAKPGARSSPRNDASEEVPTKRPRLE